MPLLDLKGITKDYKLGKTVVHALRGLDIHIEEGEIVAIMGPSGSGKSTLMHILGCLDTPTSGTASIEGTEIRSLKEGQLTSLRGQKIGFVFQTFNLMQTLSAQQNVELPMIFQASGKRSVPSGQESSWRRSAWRIGSGTDRMNCREESVSG